MTTTHDRIVQAEEGIAQVQGVLDHAQQALAVAEQVESVAHRGRKWLAALAVLGVLAVLILVVMKVTRRSGGGPELSLVEDPAAGDDGPGGPAGPPPAS
jgi:hypothetical protein